jgi:hypothetical protein
MRRPYVLSGLAKSLMRSIQLRYSLSYLFPPRTPKKIAVELSIVIDEFSRLYEQDPRAPRRVRFYFMCGVPLMAFMMHRKGAIDLDAAIAGFTVIRRE